MPKFLVTYHGGEGMPESPEALQAVKQAFFTWAASVGDALVDSGAPLVAMRAVSASSVVDGPAAGPAGGYTLLDAPDISTAVSLVEGHPFLQRGGTLQVSEAANLG